MHPAQAGGMVICHLIFIPLLVTASLAAADRLHQPAPGHRRDGEPGKDFLDQAPWLAFAPGGAILLAVMGFNFVGDVVRDVLDPRLRK